MIVQHSEYIRKLSDQTGKTYRELESMWKIATSMFQKMQMMEPSKYMHLQERDAESQEIKNIFEKTVLNLPEINKESEADKAEEEKTTQAEEDFAGDIEEEIAPEAELAPETETPESDEFTDVALDDEGDAVDEKFPDLEEDSTDENPTIEDKEGEEDQKSETDELFNEIENDGDRTINKSK